MNIEDGTFTCVDLVKCMFDLSQTEMIILQSMEETEAYTAHQLGEFINRDRATAYRALEKLLSIGLLYKERKGREGRGYSNYYSKVASKKILKKAEQKLDRYYTAIKSGLMNEQ